MNIEELGNEIDRLSKTAVTSQQKQEVEKYRGELVNMKKALSERDELEKKAHDEYLQHLENVAREKSISIKEKVVDPIIQIKKLEQEIQSEGSTFDIDIYSQKQNKLNELRNQVRISNGLEPKKDSYISNKTILKLQDSGILSEFMKANRSLKDRISVFLSEREAVQNIVKDRDVFLRLAVDEKNQLKERPQQFIKSQDRKGRVSVIVNKD